MKRLPLVAVPVALVLALGACSGSGDSASSAGSDGKKVDLTFWHGYTEADGKVLNKIVEDFNASHPTIHITTQVNPWSVIDDTFLTALSAKNGPDIVAMPAERIPVYAAKGAFVPLDDFYAKDPSTPDLNKGALDMVTVQDKKVAVPTGFTPLAMYYNKALFKKADVAVPTTWDEWVAAAKKLTVDSNGDGTPEQYGLLLPDHATVANGVWPTLFYGGGGDIVKNGKPVIDSSANAATLKFWHDAIVKDKISPTGVDGTTGDKLFSSGRVGMYLGGPWMASICTENKLDCGMAPVPAGPKAQAASAIGVAMALTVQADPAKRKAAEEFFSYFLSHDVDVTWSLGSGWPPLRTDVKESEVASNPTVKSLTGMAQLGRPLLPGVVDSTDVLTAVDELTQKTLTGQPIPGGLSTAQKQIDQALSK